MLGAAGASAGGPSPAPAPQNGTLCLTHNAPRMITAAGRRGPWHRPAPHALPLSETSLNLQILKSAARQRPRHHVSPGGQQQSPHTQAGGCSPPPTHMAACGYVSALQCCGGSGHIPLGPLLRLQPYQLRQYDSVKSSWGTTRCAQQHCHQPYVMHRLQCMSRPAHAGSRMHTPLFSGSTQSAVCSQVCPAGLGSSMLPRLGGCVAHGQHSHPHFISMQPCQVQPAAPLHVMM